MTPAKKRQRREYLRLLDKSKEAAECAIDNFNRAKGAFSTEATLMLLGVAWELLAKAILVHAKKTIKKTSSEDSISAEVAVSRLLSEGKIDKHYVDFSMPCDSQYYLLNPCFRAFPKTNLV